MKNDKSQAPPPQLNPKTAIEFEYIVSEDIKPLSNPEAKIQYIGCRLTAFKSLLWSPNPCFHAPKSCCYCKSFKCGWRTNHWRGRRGIKGKESLGAPSGFSINPSILQLVLCTFLQRCLKWIPFLVRTFGVSFNPHNIFFTRFLSS